MTGRSAPNRVAERRPDPRGRRVGVDGEQRDDVAGVRPHVRGVDAAVRAHEPVVRLGDQHAALHADDPAGLLEDDLDLAGVAAPLVGPLHGPGARRDGPQVDDRALGLGHDLLGHDQHVAGLERGARPRSPRARRRSSPRGRRRGGPRAGPRAR